MIKNPPAMWETCVQFLHWEDPLEKEMAIHSSILLIIVPVNIILCFVDKYMNLFKIVLTLFYDLLGPVLNVAKYRRLEPGCSIALLADSQRS